MLNTGYFGNMATKATFTVFLFLSLFGLNTSLYRKHYYVDKHRSWSDAQTHCRNYYDDLSIVRNEELKPLSDNPQVTEDFFWIGLSRRNPSSNQWKWTGGENATDISWDENEPTMNNEQCGAVKKSTSKVHDDNCNQPKTFYCMKISKLILVQQESTWEEALLYCSQNYKDMAVLNSDEIMTEARDQSSLALTDDLWIGLRFIVGHWLWTNGEAIQYNGWSSDAELQCPAMNQRCAVLNRNSKVWKPVNCEKRLNFFCIDKP